MTVDDFTKQMYSSWLAGAYLLWVLLAMITLMFSVLLADAGHRAAIPRLFRRRSLKASGDHVESLLPATAPVTPSLVNLEARSRLRHKIDITLSLLAVFSALLPVAALVAALTHLQFFSARADSEPATRLSSGSEAAESLIITALGFGPFIVTMAVVVLFNWVSVARLTPDVKTWEAFRRALQAVNYAVSNQATPSAAIDAEAQAASVTADWRKITERQYKSLTNLAESLYGEMVIFSTLKKGLPGPFAEEARVFRAHILDLRETAISCPGTAVDSNSLTSLLSRWDEGRWSEGPADPVTEYPIDVRPVSRRRDSLLSFAALLLILSFVIVASLLFRIFPPNTTLLEATGPFIALLLMATVIFGVFRSASTPLQRLTRAWLDNS